MSTPQYPPQDWRLAFLAGRLAQLEQGQQNLPPVELVEGLGTGAAFVATGAPATAVAAGGPAVDDTLRGVLGWSWQPDDTEGFEAALERTFQLADDEGTARTISYTPRGFAVQPDQGEITGVQSFLLQRAEDLVSTVVPRIQELQPLIPDFDPQQVAALRAIVIDEVRQLATEFAQLGGPRPQFVDEIWRSLLGAYPQVNDPEVLDPTSHLAQLRELAAWRRDRVNNIEQDRIYASWIGSVDLIQSLYRTWLNQRAYFVGGPGVQPYWGTQLVLISRQLDVLQQSVDEFEQALVASLIDPAEQATLLLNVQGAPIYLRSIIEQARSLAQSAARTLQDAGREGARALIAPFWTLVAAAHEALPPVGGFPYLYNASALVYSTANALEINLIRILQLLIPFDPGLGGGIPPYYGLPGIATGGPPPYPPMGGFTVPPWPPGNAPVAQTPAPPPSPPTGPGYQGGPPITPPTPRSPIDHWRVIPARGELLGVHLVGTNLPDDLTVKLRHQPTSGDAIELGGAELIHGSAQHRLFRLPLDGLEVNETWKVIAETGDGQEFALGDTQLWPTVTSSGALGSAPLEVGPVTEWRMIPAKSQAVGVHVAGDELPENLVVKLRRAPQDKDDSPVEITGAIAATDEQAAKDKKERVYRIPLGKLDREGTWQIVAVHSEDKEHVLGETQFWT